LRPVALIARRTCPGEGGCPAPQREALFGRFVDLLQLSEEDSKTVHATLERRNLANCQSGLANCRPLDLGEADLAAVRAAFHSRNVESCKHGLPECDPSLLDGPEMASVVAAFQQRSNRARSPQTQP